MKSPEHKLELCRRESAQLLIIDAQERLLGAMPDACGQNLERNIVRLGSAAAELGIPVIATAQYPKGLGPICAQVAAQVPEQATIFEKTAFSCCSADGFEELLTADDRRQVVVTGLETHVCVLQTAAGLMHWGYDVFVVGDAVCSRDPENRVNALQRLTQAGAIITNTESVIFEWLQDASHPSFKTLSRLIR